MENREQELLSYACEKFEGGEYDAALEAFVLAYSKGCEQEWILENIYNCYMAGNEEAFREAYRQRMTGENVSYEECLLDFIPYRDGEYYIFDKEMCVFRGIFSVPALQEAEPDLIFKNIEFSAAALALDWDFREWESILTVAEERKIYMVCHDAKRCLSFWKIPELAGYMKNIKVFLSFGEMQDYFHEHTSEYLPMIISGNQEDEMELVRIRNEEHAYRLTPEGRNTESVLLTIAIPTAHRGNLVLKRLEKLLTMSYDAEIEIVVSKNGNDLYEEEYKTVSEIQDARLHYYDHGKLLLGFQNWHYAVKISSGKYVMLTSDEDDVMIGELEHYLKLLSSHPDLAYVRPKSVKLYHRIEERKYGRKGWEAFDVLFLTQNHFPGMIVRRKDFLEENLLALEDKYSENFYFKSYRHEWWALMLGQRGDVVEEPILFYDDSHPLDQKEERKKLGINEPIYGLYESRIKQFQGYLEFLQSVMKISDKEKFEKYLNRAIGKVTWLFEIVRKEERNSENFEKMLEQLAAVCIKAIEDSCLDNIQKENMLRFLGGCCLDCIEEDEKLKAEGR